MVKSGQAWAGLVVTRDATGALAAASVGPAGTLYVNGTANGASVTITGSNPYKWAVTLPSLTAGDSVSMYITATVGGIATAAVVAEEIGDTSRVSDVETDTADIQSRLPAALVSGRMDSSTGAMAADVITASAYDESTAYPLKQADTGSTTVARTGADGDTLETLSDQIDGAATAANLATLTGYVDTEVAAIKAKTDNLPASPAATGDAMTLAANAVTAAAVAADAGAEIAAAVRTELTTELARIDVATSTRLAPTVALRTLDVNANGNAGIDWGNIDNTGATNELSDTIIYGVDHATLDAGSLTALSFDQTTAFPLTQADTGSTAVARTGADSDTLETLSDQIDGVGGSGLTAQETRDALKLAPSAGAAAAGSIDDLLGDMPATILATAVAAYAGTPGTVGYLLSLLAGLDFTAVNLVATSNAGEITIKRTLTMVAVVSGLVIPADWTACYWTLKRSVDDADADALAQVLVSNPPDAEDGLQVLAGAAVEDETAGSLTVNQAGGTVTIALDDASTGALDDAVELVWDVKVHAPGGKTQPGAGTATITTAVTRA